jgi:secreted trypsin-like serine protease
MMFSSSNQWVLVGLTSSGIGCARATDSGLYTRVAAFQDWINSNTNGAVTSFVVPGTTTASNTSQKVVSTSTPSGTISHGNIVKTSIFPVFIFVLFDLFGVQFN